METSSVFAGHDAAREFYFAALERLNETRIPFLVGGAFAFSQYTGIARETKDIDLFVKPEDCPRVLHEFSRLDCRTELTFPHWLGKIRYGDYLIDVIFNSGNGVARVDDLWFDHAPSGRVIGVMVKLTPPEEMIWSKAFIQERERFDGADVLHLLRQAGRSLDWPRLLMRFGDHWAVLLSHLILFQFVYPNQRQNVPEWVLRELLSRQSDARPEPRNAACYGTLLSREQYLFDLEHWSYEDARERPRGPMTREELEIWTAAIEEKK